MLKVSVNEQINTPVHNRIHIARFHIGPMVFDQTIRLKKIGPDLAAPSNFTLGPANLRELLFLLFTFLFQQPGHEHAHGSSFVLNLGALILALDNNACGQMRDTHCRIGFVDVLSSGAARAVGIDFQIFAV